MHNLWLLKDCKLKASVRNNKVKEEFYKNKSMLKIKNKSLRKSQQEKMLKNHYQASKIKYLTNYKKQDI